LQLISDNVCDCAKRALLHDCVRARPSFIHSVVVHVTLKHTFDWLVAPESFKTHQCVDTYACPIVLTSRTLQVIATALYTCEMHFTTECSFHGVQFTVPWSLCMQFENNANIMPSNLLRTNGWTA